MARPGLAMRSRDEFEAARPDYPMRYRTEPAPPQRPTLPSRIGAGSRPRRPATRSDGLLLWRILGVSAATLIFGMGGLLAYHLVSPPTAPSAALAPAPAPAQSTASQVAATQVATTQVAATQAAGTQPTPAPTMAPQPLRPAQAGASPSALKVASILGSEAAVPAADGPTPADFARPAFLEPIGDAADDDATLPDGAVETVAEGTPPNAIVPLPAPRPLKMAAADAPAADDDGARSARIRSAVTLRSGPRRSASAIGTLEAGTKVKLYSCKSWCEVASGDKRGWVYKASVER